MAAQQSALKWTPLGYQQATATNVAQNLPGLGVAIPTDAVMVLIATEGAIRWRDDGTPPSATVGMPMVAGQEFQYSVPDFTQIVIVSQSGGVKVNFNFYK